jgi:selenocysteine-specific elongation factor
MSEQTHGYFIIGTAGHVDHGKTELIKRLTGIDTDRLPEEKKRGMSIDIGFAYFDLPDGKRVGIVDVPGHERFVHNMLAGAAGIDMVLMVVAADEGVMAQTVEHLNILQLLGVNEGIIVVTKKDLVDEAWLELVCEDIRERFRGTFLEHAPMVAVSSVTGEGFDELLKLIQQKAKEVIPHKDVERPFRLPIDRAFIKSGFGVIVTGTAFSGEVCVGQEVEIMPLEIRTRIRSMQVHGNSVEKAFAGQRVAMNLVGIEREEISRGCVVTEVGYMKPTNRIVVKLRLLEDAKKPLKDGAPVRLHIGTGEWIARALLLKGDELEPGEEEFVELRTDEKIACVRYDRFVIRSYSPQETIGGGLVIEPYPQRYRRRSPQYYESCVRKASTDYKETALALLDEHKDGLKVSELSVLLHLKRELTAKLLEELCEEGKAIKLSDVFFMSAKSYDTASEELLSLLRSYHSKHPLHMGMKKVTLLGQLESIESDAVLELLLKRLEVEGRVVVEKELVRLPEHSPKLTGRYSQIADRMLKLCANAGFTPPSTQELLQQFSDEGEVASEVLHALIEGGQLLHIDEFVVHPQTVEEAKRIVREHISQNGRITLAEFRDITKTTRKYALPLLEHLDKIGFTQRIGDHRILRTHPSHTEG